MLAVQDEVPLCDPLKLSITMGSHSVLREKLQNRESQERGSVSTSALYTAISTEITASQKEITNAAILLLTLPRRC